MTVGAEREPGKRFFDLEAWRYFEGLSPGRLGILLVLGIVAAAQSLLLMPVLLLIRYAIDTVIPHRQIGLLILLGAGIFGLRALSSAIALWLRSAHVRVLKQATLRLREDLLNRLYLMSRATYTKLDRDTTHARIVLDTERLDEMSHAVVSRLLPALFSALTLLILLAFLNARLLIVTLVLSPLLLIAVRFTGRLVKQRVFAFQRAFEVFSKGMQFVLQQMDLTRIQSFESREKERRVVDLGRLRAASERMAFIYA